MINLLPPDLKRDYALARRNAGLRKILTLIGFGLAGLLLLVGAGILYLDQASKAYTTQAEAAEVRLHEQKQDEVEKRVQEISGSLKLAVQVLSQQVLFSKLLKQLAVVTPSNVSLSGINISKLQGAVDLTAKTTDYNAATQLQINLTDPNNKIFSKADILNITCPTSDGTPVRYPCTVTIRAEFATADNPLLFVNSKAGS